MDEQNDFPGVADFLAWLYQHQDEIVGNCIIPVSCPLARWLSEVRGIPYKVGVCLYSPFDGSDAEWGTGGLLPAWASEFVSEIDTLGSDQVTGNEAINVLAVVLALEAGW